MPTDEEKLLAILNHPDLPEPIEQSAAEVLDEDSGNLDEEQRATLQAILQSKMPTPAEIERDAKMAAHNAEIQRKRNEDLARRRERRAKTNKNKKRRRSR